MKSNNRRLVIWIGLIAVIACILFWKWPRPLVSYFNNAAQPNAGWLLLLRGREDARELEFDDQESLNSLWEAVQHTKIRHLGRYTIIPLEESLYRIQLTTWEDDRVTSSLYFGCDDNRNVYINNSKYAIVGSSELIPVLEEYFPY